MNDSWNKSIQCSSSSDESYLSFTVQCVCVCVCVCVQLVKKPGDTKHLWGRRERPEPQRVFDLSIWKRERERER